MIDICNVHSLAHTEEANLQNEEARIRVDSLNTEAHNLQLKETMRRTEEELNGKDRLIEKYQLEIRQRNDEIEKKVRSDPFKSPLRHATYTFPCEPCERQKLCTDADPNVRLNGICTSRQQFPSSPEKCDPELA